MSRSLGGTWDGYRASRVSPKGGGRQAVWLEAGACSMMRICFLSRRTCSNLTRPGTVAKTVKSRPRPVPGPARKVMPRWRTMIEPAVTSWPSPRLTPRRWPTLSRPFLELEPAFLWAMALLVLPWLVRGLGVRRGGGRLGAGAAGGLGGLLGRSLGGRCLGRRELVGQRLVGGGLLGGCVLGGL